MLPSPVFNVSAEPLMGSDESVCEPNAHRPGVLAFKDFVLKHQGGDSYGTSRPCVPGVSSGHHAGRAWDWAMDAYDPQDRGRVDELLDWLTANDAELFRRAGLAYMLWDKRSWSAFRPQWRPYDGFDEQGDCSSGVCRDPHTNHVHFSFNWPGADGETSLYRWLSSNRPVAPPPTPLVQPVAPADFAAKVIPLLAGAVLGFTGLRLMTRTRWQRFRGKA